MNDALIPLAAIALPAFIVPTVLIFRHESQKREMQHRERMKALETGQPVPGEAAWPVAVAASAIGAGVPLGSFLLTMIASLNSPGIPNEIWIAPTIVSIFALGTSIGVAKVMIKARKPAQVDPHLNGKPMAYDDAYDVVGSRG